MVPLRLASGPAAKVPRRKRTRANIGAWHGRDSQIWGSARPLLPLGHIQGTSHRDRAASAENCRDLSRRSTSLSPPSFKVTQMLDLDPAYRPAPTWTVIGRRRACGLFGPTRRHHNCQVYRPSRPPRSAAATGLRRCRVSPSLGSRGRGATLHRALLPLRRPPTAAGAPTGSDTSPSSAASVGNTGPVLTPAQAARRVTISSSPLSGGTRSDEIPAPARSQPNDPRRLNDLS